MQGSVLKSEVSGSVNHVCFFQHCHSVCAEAGFGGTSYLYATNLRGSDKRDMSVLACLCVFSPIMMKVTMVMCHR